MPQQPSLPPPPLTVLHFAPTLLLHLSSLSLSLSFPPSGCILVSPAPPLQPRAASRDRRRSPSQGGGGGGSEGTGPQRAESAGPGSGLRPGMGGRGGVREGARAGRRAVATWRMETGSDGERGGAGPAACRRDVLPAARRRTGAGARMKCGAILRCHLTLLRSARRPGAR